MGKKRKLVYFEPVHPRHRSHPTQQWHTRVFCDRDYISTQTCAGGLNYSARPARPVSLYFTPDWFPLPFLKTKSSRLWNEEISIQAEMRLLSELVYLQILNSKCRIGSIRLGPLIIRLGPARLAESISMPGLARVVSWGFFIFCRRQEIAE